MRRREFISFLGGAAVAWPLAAWAQQAAVPVIGFLNPTSAYGYAERLRAFRSGLAETGYVEGQNVAIDSRSAEGQFDRLPAMAADLVRRQVAVIVAAAGPAPVFAAKRATTTIPVVFAIAEDPVRLGLVASLARPGGNLTGINFFIGEVAAKRLGFLRELVPGISQVAVLVNPADPVNADSTLNGVQAAADAIGLQIQVAHASSSSEIDAVFAMFARQRPDALYVGGDSLLNSRRLQLALLAARHAVPASYGSRDYPESGGLMSYGTNVTDAFRQIGIYTDRILKGAKPEDLPVVQASKFELVINIQRARVLGITVPASLLAIADEVIE
jgi:ABC-type uncharacterized transport system substrate-binding protein